MQHQRLSAIYDILKASRKVSGKGDFAAKTGYDRSYVSELFNNRKPITEAFELKLEELYNINLHWFRTGDGEMFNTSLDNVLKATIDAVEESDVAYNPASKGNILQRLKNEVVELLKAINSPTAEDVEEAADLLKRIENWKEKTKDK